MARIHITFNVEEEVKKEFNIACIEHGLNMSETVENLMINFVISCARMKEKKEEVKLVIEEEPDLTESTRLE